MQEEAFASTVRHLAERERTYVNFIVKLPIQATSNLATLLGKELQRDLFIEHRMACRELRAAAHGKQITLWTAFFETGASLDPALPTTKAYSREKAVGTFKAIVKRCLQVREIKQVRIALADGDITVGEDVQIDILAEPRGFLSQVIRAVFRNRI